MKDQYSYTIVLEPLEDGGFLVRVPALPEIVSHGATEEEAVAMAEDAIRLVLGYRRDHGEPIPSEKAPQLRKVTVQA